MRKRNRVPIGPSVKLTEAEEKALSEEYEKGNIVDPHIHSEEELATFPAIGALSLSHNSIIEFDPEEDGSYAHKFVKTINGAEVKVPFHLEEQIKTYIEPVQEGGEQAIGYSINIGSSEHLSDIFQQTPYGVIKKNRTGVGATTLELISPRNSIIVVPTKALAYEKYKTGIDSQTTVSKYLYVGSAIDELPDTETAVIENYLSNSAIREKKILVVADSLGKVMRFIDPKDWFIMVDEIDMYQIDATFRESMEVVIDYYYTFPYAQRCLVSATIRPFSNPFLNAEPVINIKYTDSERKRITVAYANNINLHVKERIIALATNRTDDKMVIAYNKITNIMQIIALLPETLQQKCAVLCGEKSKPKAGDYAKILINRRLPNQINFITSAYFIGVDIEETFHLISVSDPKSLYTLLSPQRLLQIAGRCRASNGLLSECVVYKTNDSYSIYSTSDILEELRVFAPKMRDIANKAGEIHKQHPKFFEKSAIVDVKNAIIETSLISIVDSAPLPYLRLNIDGECVISYLIIDAMLEYAELRHDLYAIPEQLPDALSEYYEVDVAPPDLRGTTEEQTIIERQTEEALAEIEKSALDILIEQLRILCADNKPIPKIALYPLRRKASKNEKIFINRFLPLYGYVPFEQLVTSLKNNILKNDTYYKGYNNSVIFWALDSTHPLKRKIKREFKRGQTYTHDEVISKTRDMLTYHADIKIDDDEKCVKIFHQFCSATRGKKTDGTVTHRIISYNPANIAGTPLHKILYPTRLNALLKL